jgi:CRP-like cAMP-binding protein
LFFLRDNFEEKNWTRREIGEWAGTTPETVMRTLADFENQGMIQQQGREIHIIDRKRLLDAAKITI